MRPHVVAAILAVLFFVTAHTASEQSRRVIDYSIDDVSDFVRIESSESENSHNARSIKPGQIRSGLHLTIPAIGTSRFEPADGAHATFTGFKTSDDFARALSAPASATLSRLSAISALRFEANRGQAPANVHYLARYRGNALLLTPHGATLSTIDATAGDSVAAVALRFVGADSKAAIAPEESLRGEVNYLLGRSSDQWRTGIPTFARVRYRGVYPGIDVIFHGDNRALEYDFVLAPGANVADIRIAFEGAENVYPAPDGALVIDLLDGTLRQPAPRIYQTVNGERITIDGRFLLAEDGTVGFEVADFDENLALVIDPVLEYSTFLGGQLDDDGLAIAVDANGGAYVTGTTKSLDFPTVGANQEAFAGGATDAFIVKLTPDGSDIEYATYIGGSQSDTASAISVDASGNAYVAGTTGSKFDFPKVGAELKDYGGGASDAFLLKLSPDGSTLDFSTYLGGEGADGASGVAVDHAGALHIAGFTDSDKAFPLMNPLQPVLFGVRDAFVARFTEYGVLEYATYFGGNGKDEATSVAVDGEGNVLIGGVTDSASGFPLSSSLQGELGGKTDGFVAKLDATDGSPIFATYFGGTKDDRVNGVAVGRDGGVFLTGQSDSNVGFQLEGALQANHGGKTDAFAAKLDPTGALVYSTYLGGAGQDVATGIAVDLAGNAVVTGETDSSALEGFPLADAVQPDLAGQSDAFVLKLKADGTGLGYATYLGGSKRGAGTGVAVDFEGNAYVTGRTNSLIDFLRKNAAQPFASGEGDDAFVGKIRSNTAPFFTSTSLPVTVGRAEQLYFYDADADDPDGDVLVFALIGSPAGMTVDVTSGEVSWLPSVEGSFDVTIEVQDGEGGAARQEFAIEVMPANEPPVITSIPIKNAIARVPYRYEVEASDADDDPVTFSLKTAPAGMTIDSVTGQILWVPKVEDAPKATVVVAANDGREGVTSQSFDIMIIVDLTPPVISVTSPQDGTLTSNSEVTITGSLDEEATLLINDTKVTLASDLSFSYGPAALREGDNIFTLAATDLPGNVATDQLTIKRDSTPPPPVDINALTLSEPQGGVVVVTGAAGSVEPLSRVEITHAPSGQVTPAAADGVGAFTATLSAQPGESLLFIVIDEAKNRSAQVGVAAHGTSGLPPDPAAVAPPVADKGVASMQALTEFLYTGAAPIQVGVAAETIQAHRVGVIRGRVTNRDGQPIPGVAISIKDHAELGETLTRIDGQFDIAVNGGGVLVIEYEKPGYLPVQRRVNVPWQDFAFADDVVMTQLDTKVGVVDLNANVPIQVVQGKQETDANGPRQATVMFNQGTAATIVLPDGTTQELSSLSVRATEYTVGPNGPRAMPARLPPSSGYTYAVELSVDEAFTAGATQVTFDRPVYLYVENFLGFPVGGAAPIGYYDRIKGLWVPSPDGRVIEVISVDGGVAEIDVEGSGIAADAEALAALGVTDVERERLASLYTPGQSLWRAPITHFSPFDINWPVGRSRTIFSAAAPGPGTGPGLGGANLNGGAGNGDNKLDTFSCRLGSVIETQNQILGESIPIVGSSFALNYRSDRVRGRKLAYALGIRLTGESVPAELDSVSLKVWIAGRRFTYEFTPAPNLDFTFEWDGLDAYGREVQGQRSARLSIGYTYPQSYFSVPLSTAFGNAPSFGLPPAPGATAVTVTRVGSSALLETTWTSALGTWDARSVGLGAWTLGVHHQYDPAGETLYLGDGRRRRAARIGPVISRVRNMTPQRSAPRGVAVAPDGSVYVAESGINIVSVTSPDGVTTTVAGGGNPADGVGDGGPATLARLESPFGIALGPDGALYISERGGPTPQRVRRVGPDGIIETIAGSGPRGFSGDGGPAVDAQLNNPNGLAVGPDGSVYIADVGNARVRRVSVDGTISTVAGNGTFGYSGDGSRATETGINLRFGLAVDSEGIIYAPDLLFIRRIHPDGTVDTLGPIPGILSQLVADLAVDGNGGVYGTTTGSNDKLFHVNAQGVGTFLTQEVYSDDCFFPLNRNCLTGDGGLSAAAILFNPWGVAVAPDKSLYVANAGVSSRLHSLRRISSPLPGFSLADTFVASEDAERVFQFDPLGRHIRTYHSLTGAVMLEFGYDTDGFLAQIADGDSNVVTVERDASGKPLALVAPDGHRTVLSVDAQGYLASVRNPAGETHRMTYTSDGLLTAFVNPRNATFALAYDALGRLESDTDPLGGGWSLAHTGSEDSFVVPVSSGESRASSFEILRAIDQDETRIDTAADGTVTQTVITAAGDETRTAPDGQIVRVRKGPDRRFGMQSPLDASTRVSMPSGLALEATTGSNVILSDQSDLLSVSLTQDFLTINGRQFSGTFEGSTRTFTLTTPAGRQSERVIDAEGRTVREVFPGQDPIDYAYDPRGRLQSITQGSGMQARTTTLTYNAAGFLGSVTDALNRSVLFDYDDAGRVVGQTQPDNRRIEFGYDANGNIVSVVPAGRPAHTFDYTAVDQETVYTPPAVDAGDPATRRFYNLDRELTREERPDGRATDLVYYGAGQLAQVGVPRGTYDLTYDSVTGQLSTLTAPDGGVLSRSFDGSLVTGSSWTGVVSGEISRSFDSDFRIDTESVNGAHTVNFAYDPDSLLTGAGGLALTRDPQDGKVVATTLSGVTTSRSYNPFGELESDTAAISGAAIYDVTYVRDKLGRITRKTETVDGVTTVFDYTYDVAGRLETITTDGVETARYVYDSNGNRTGGFILADSISATYDAQDRLNSYNQLTYTYTANGELLTKTDAVTGEDTQYNYDVLGNLMSVTLPDDTLIEYVIDGRNRRVGRKVNGTLVQGFLYKDQLNPVAELDGASNVVSRFVYGDKPHVPAYLQKGGQIYRIVSGHLGSVRLVIDTATGFVAQRIDYDEFGNVLTDTNPGFQPFGYAGGIYDTDTGLVRFGARDYDPEIGRWTAKDPIQFDGNGLSLYEYALNNPINLIDKTGLEASFPGGFSDLTNEQASNADLAKAVTLTFLPIALFTGPTALLPGAVATFKSSGIVAATGVATTLLASVADPGPTSAARIALDVITIGSAIVGVPSTVVTLSGTFNIAFDISSVFGAFDDNCDE